MIAIFLGITPRLKRNIFVFIFIVVTKLCSSCNKRKVVLPDVMCKMSEILRDIRYVILKHSEHSDSDKKD